LAELGHGFLLLRISLLQQAGILVSVATAGPYSVSLALVEVSAGLALRVQFEDMTQPMKA
jgi:hypothetical protein